MDFKEEHIKRIIQLEPAINQLFEEFLWEVAPHLRRISYTGRGIWSRNPVIEKQVDDALREFAAKYKALIQKYTTKAWELCELKNDELFLKFLKGAGVVFGSKFLLDAFNRSNPQGVPVDISTVLTLPRRMAARDAFFKNRLDEMISSRVWDLVGQNKTLILNCTSSGILQGKSAAKISQELRKYLKEPNRLYRRVRDPKTGKMTPSKAMLEYHPGQGVYRSSYKNAIRLARNETNMAYRGADMDRWSKTDFILGYEVKLSNSHVVEDMCNDLQGQYPKNFTFLSWHTMCLCYVVPILASQDQFVQNLQHDTPIKGHITKIPSRATKYVNEKATKIMDMPAKKRPYWIQDNYKVEAKSLKLNIKTHSYANT